MVKKATKKAAVKKTATVKKTAAPKAAVKKTAAPAKKAAKPAAAKKVKVKSARKPNAAFLRPLTPSAHLSAVIGAAPIPRTEVVKKIWAYIKKNNLQNPKNKRNILADDKLSKVFGKKEVTMFELASLIGKHLK